MSVPAYPGCTVLAVAFSVLAVILAVIVVGAVIIHAA